MSLEKITLLEKEKMLVTSMFSSTTMFFQVLFFNLSKCDCFAKNILISTTFSARVHQSTIAQNLETDMLTLFQTSPCFNVCSVCLTKALWEEEKLLVPNNFSFSYSVFYPFGELPAIFMKSKTVICRLFQFGRVLNLSFGKGWNTLSTLQRLSEQK